MNADDLKKLTTESLKELAALLEQGRSERLIALLKTMGRFHRYSLHNVCLIVAQRPSATRVAGFHTWRSVGRFVRKGEKGIAILAPIVRRRREESAGGIGPCVWKNASSNSRTRSAASGSYGSSAIVPPRTPQDCRCECVTASLGRDQPKYMPAIRPHLQSEYR
jgi:hypothetical protein